MSAKSEAHYELAIALAEVCQLDFDLNKGRLFTEAKLFYQSGVTPEQIRERYGPGGWWYSSGDFRASGGRPPNPWTIRQTWKQSVPQPPRDRRQEALAAMRSVAQQKSEE